jgi:hypothetical protein
LRVVCYKDPVQHPENEQERKRKLTVGDSALEWGSAKRKEVIKSDHGRIRYSH